MHWVQIGIHWVNLDHVARVVDAVDDNREPCFRLYTDTGTELAVGSGHFAAVLKALGSNEPREVDDAVKVLHIP